MKKLASKLFSFVVFVGALFALLASTISQPPTFEKLIPTLQQTHPRFNVQQLENVYNDCYQLETKDRSECFKNMWPKGQTDNL